jgi:hypothetical protein
MLSGTFDNIVIYSSTALGDLIFNAPAIQELKNDNLI